MVLEEAAGIALYRQRQREAQNHLEEAEIHLNRLADLLREVVEGEAASLEGEALRARRYLWLKGLEEYLELHLKNRQREDLLRRIEGARRELEEIRGELASLKEREAAMAEKEEALNRRREELVGLAKQGEEEGRLWQDRLLRLEGEKRGLLSQKEVWQKQREEDRKIIRSLREEREALNLFWKEIEEERERLRLAHHVFQRYIGELLPQKEELERERDFLEKKIEALRNSLFQATHKRALYHNQVSRLEERLDSYRRLHGEKKKLLAEERAREESLKAESEQIGEEKAWLEGGDLCPGNRRRRTPGGDLGAGTGTDCFKKKMATMSK
ncbi:MAG TPA: hypothetical protein ENM97_02395 [Moorella mulderi]|nr:hypothetical protein [Moorella mulderi]